MSTYAVTKPGGGTITGRAAQSQAQRKRGLLSSPRISNQPILPFKSFRWAGNNKDCRWYPGDGKKRPSWIPWGKVLLLHILRAKVGDLLRRPEIVVFIKLGNHLGKGWPPLKESYLLKYSGLHCLCYCFSHWRVSRRQTAPQKTQKSR